MTGAQETPAPAAGPGPEGPYSEEDDREYCCDAEYGTEAERHASEWVQRAQKQQFKPFATGTFARNIKSGASLCRLINAIRPGMIETIHDTHLGTKQVENVNAFRSACKLLGVCSKSVCSVADIQEMHSTSKAVHTVHALACAIRTSAPDFQGPFLTEPLGQSGGRRRLSETSSSAEEDSMPEGLILDMEEVEAMAPPSVLSSRAQQVCPAEVVNSPRAIAANLDPASLPPRTPSKRTPQHTTRLNMSGSGSWGAGGGGAWQKGPWDGTQE